jgi:Oxidoreductase FAD-binding domain
VLCTAGAPPSQAAEARDADGRLVALNPRKRIKFALIEKEVRLVWCRDVQRAPMLRHVWVESMKGCCLSHQFVKHNCLLLWAQVLSHNVRRFRFALQSPKHIFGLPVGQHVFLYAKCASACAVAACRMLEPSCSLLDRPLDASLAGSTHAHVSLHVSDGLTRFSTCCIGLTLQSERGAGCARILPGQQR